MTTSPPLPARSRDDLAALARALREQHRPGRPLVLPNAWDAATARLVEQAGFPAVATTSAGLVRALGWKDGSHVPADEVFAAIERISRSVTVPVTADVEDGYGLDPGELVARLLAAGAVGMNLEDTDHRAAVPGLVEVEAQAGRIAAVKDAGRAQGVDVVVNARTDAFVRGGDPAERLADARRRAARYREAGADCVYPIGVPTDAAGEAAIQALVGDAAGGNINIMARLGTPLDRLAALGVARISFGAAIATVANAAVADALTAIRASQRVGGPIGA
ncbi:MAG: isocitrate lyase/PEP mutase family protein [Frankia sp.]